MLHPTYLGQLLNSLSDVFFVGGIAFASCARFFIDTVNSQDLMNVRKCPNDDACLRNFSVLRAAGTGRFFSLVRPAKKPCKIAKRKKNSLNYGLVSKGIQPLKEIKPRRVTTTLPGAGEPNSAIPGHPSMIPFPPPPLQRPL